MQKLNHTRLAEGEMTGHYHQAVGDGVALYEAGPGAIVLEAPSGATITHQEHHALVVPPGLYSRSIVQEYDHFAEEAREVQD